MKTALAEAGQQYAQETEIPEKGDHPMIGVDALAAIYRRMDMMERDIENLRDQLDKMPAEMRALLDMAFVSHEAREKEWLLQSSEKIAAGVLAKLFGDDLMTGTPSEVAKNIRAAQTSLRATMRLQSIVGTGIYGFIGAGILYFVLFAIENGKAVFRH